MAQTRNPDAGNGMRVAPAPTVPRWHKFDAFRRQESTLIILNLGVLVSLLVLQAAFTGIMGMPDSWLILLFGGRFVGQLMELLFLHNLARPWPAPRIRAYEHFSIAAHVAFAVAVSLLSTREDSHYAVLLVIPVVAAAFRYGLPGALAVAAFGSAISLVEVRIGETMHSFSEYFEALTTGILFLLVSIVVHALVKQFEQEQARRQETADELAITRERLVREEKLGVVGRFAGAVAHEIRNPIAMISSSLSAAAENKDDPVLQQEMFDIAVEESARLERFTTDFLAYARTTAPQTEPIDPCITLRYVADLARAQAKERRITVRVVCDEQLEISADSYQLQQALLNLTRNALDATPPDGTITLRGEKQGDEIHLHVENDGIPIDDTVVQRLFEPFYTTKPRGTGLGLGIAQNTFLAHGGSLALTCNGPDLVRFTATLPVASGATGD
jgi:two-component system sensor histidine kinase HydH